MTMTLISTVTVGSGGAASLDMTSIPGTFTDLLLVFSLRGTATGPDNQLSLSINGSNGTDRVLYGFGSSAGTNGDATKIRGNANGNTATANTFGNGQAYIPNYTATGQKSVVMESVGETNATAAGMYITAGLSTSTSAVTSISLVPDGGYNWMQYSTASLYGILKGSGGATVS